MKDKPIFVTQPSLPPLVEFTPYLEKIWDSKIITNNGPFHRQLEKELCEYLEVEHISLFSNGTIALVIALQALGVTGEVITTPYSFVATAHSILWNKLVPVFVDVDPRTCNIDPLKIEEAITPNTTCIMPVHCYGFPCDVDAIEELANKYNLKVIYDAAHAFGVKYKNKGLLQYGDLSVLSFHATKVFNTFEGGAIVCPDLETKKRIDFLKNFGFADEVTVTALGINGKMSEINSAMGLLQLTKIESLLLERKKIAKMYRLELENIEGIDVPNIPSEVIENASYFPIFVTDSYFLSRDELYEKLKSFGIHGRRYFYPLISDFPMYRKFESTNPKYLSHARMLSEQVICLPIYPTLLVEDVLEIASILRGKE